VSREQEINKTEHSLPAFLPTEPIWPRIKTTPEQTTTNFSQEPKRPETRLGQQKNAAQFLGPYELEICEGRTETGDGRVIFVECEIINEKVSCFVQVGGVD
jgi:hypothetical protein